MEKLIGERNNQTKKRSYYKGELGEKILVPYLLWGLKWAECENMKAFQKIGRKGRGGNGHQMYALNKQHGTVGVVTMGTVSQRDKEKGSCTYGLN